MYYGPDDPRISLRGPLLAAGGLVLAVLLIRGLAGHAAAPDRELVELASLLVRVQLTSTLVASALTFAAVVFASAIIPLTVVWAFRFHERPARPVPPSSAGLPDAPAGKALPQQPRRRLPAETPARSDDREPSK